MTRRALRQQLPALTAFYGLRPWEVEHLTFGELAEYLDHMERVAREQQALERRLADGS